MLILFEMTPGVASGQALVGTYEGSGQAVLFPAPDAGLPFPAQVPISGIPAGSNPSGVTFASPALALVTNSGFGQVFVIDTAQRQVLSVIATPGYLGFGTIAVSPNGLYALASGATNAVTVIRAPFNAASVVTTTPLQGGVADFNTQSIVFSPDGRAFIYDGPGIEVLDPPYSSVAFAIPLFALNAGRLAISPDGTHLFATLFDGPVQVYSAPYSAMSIAVPLVIPGGQTGGLAVTPDGQKLLATLANATRLFVASAPFGPSSTVEEIPLPGPFSQSEDIGISADGRLAILAGSAGGTNPSIAFVRGPFTSSGATVFDVRIPGGRGAGAARFAPPGSGSSGIPAMSGGGQWMFVLLLAAAGMFSLRRF